MSNFTHIKKPYRARCIQNTNENLEEMFDLMSARDYVQWHPSVHGTLYFQHRDDSRTKLRILSGWWVRVGENGSIKSFSDDEFQLKYQPIENSPVKESLTTGIQK